MTCTCPHCKARSIKTKAQRSDTGAILLWFKNKLVHETAAKLTDNTQQYRQKLSYYKLELRRRGIRTPP